MWLISALLALEFTTTFWKFYVWIEELWDSDIGDLGFCWDVRGIRVDKVVIFDETEAAIAAEQQYLYLFVFVGWRWDIMVIVLIRDIFVIL